jgi:FhuF 2Fe-2S C-terminal domain
MTSDTSVRLTDQVLPALVTAAQFGPFFRWEPWSPDAGWLPWASLADGDLAAQRVEVARDTLIGMFGLPPGDVPVRVVASVTFLGWAARVVSPLLGAAVAGGDLPAARPDQIWWQPPSGGPLPMAYETTQARPCARMDLDALAEALAEVAVGGLLRPLLDTFAERFTLSRQVLLGNVASALGGAAGMIADQSPGHAERAAGVVDAMLKLEPLTGTGTLVQPFEDRARRFLIRNSCCLYYRIPGGGTCGDCVLTLQDERRRGWEAVLRR